MDRLEKIDFLRAVSMIGVIIIHTFSYNLKNSADIFIWNISEWVVVGFVFCSGYVLTGSYQHKFGDTKQILRWIGRRAKRLLIPFYIYLLIHYALWFLLPGIFSGLGLDKNPLFIIESIFLVGGISLNWLTLLFLQMTILFPIFIKNMSSKKFLFSYIILAVFVTTIFTIHSFNDYYRILMWIPWSLVLLLSIYFFNREEKYSRNLKLYIGAAVLSGLIFAPLLISFLTTNRSINLIENKYPPNLFYLSASFLVTCLVFLIGDIDLLEKPVLRIGYTYISKSSYQLFFIHFIVLDAVLTLSKKGIVWSNPRLQLLIVLPLSILSSLALDKIKSYIND